MASQDASEYVWPPTVAGFDLPAPCVDGEGKAEPLMLAFLSARPDHYWIEAFVAEVDEFKAQHQLHDVRIDARQLVVTGPAAQLRAVTSDLRDFVHRVSRLSLQRRMRERLAPGSTLAKGENATTSRDVALIARMPGVASILQAVSRETGMRFVTVAKVSDTRWTACAVYDAIQFGLRAGQDLVLETTICNDIRQHGQTVTFNHASTHPIFSNHPTPALYGFESYIAVPIYRAYGQFFGTLCAVDPQPRQLDPATIQAVEKFARAIGAEIDTQLLLAESQVVQAVVRNE